MAIGKQAINGKDLGDRLNEDEATKALAASFTRSYQFKTYTVPGGPGFVDQDLSLINADAPNPTPRLLKDGFKRAYRIFIRADVDISFKLGDNTDAIPVKTLQGGQFEEVHVEFEKVLITAPVAAVIDVLIS